MLRCHTWGFFFFFWGFYPTKMPMWLTRRVPWGHSLTHLPVLAQQLGTCHSRWACPDHLWALPLIVPMPLAFPRSQTLLWQRLVLLSLHLPRETPCCVLSLDPVWLSHLWGQSSDQPTNEIAPLLQHDSFLPRMYLEGPALPAQTFQAVLSVLQVPQGPPDVHWGPLLVTSEDSLCHCLMDESFSLWLLSSPFLCHMLGYLVGSWLTVQGYGSWGTILYSSPGDMAKSGSNLDSTGQNDLDQGMELLWTSASSSVIVV